MFCFLYFLVNVFVVIYDNTQIWLAIVKYESNVITLLRHLNYGLHLIEVV